MGISYLSITASCQVNMPGALPARRRRSGCRRSDLRVSQRLADAIAGDDRVEDSVAEAVGYLPPDPLLQREAGIRERILTCADDVAQALCLDLHLAKILSEIGLGGLFAKHEASQAQE